MAAALRRECPAPPKPATAAQVEHVFVCQACEPAWRTGSTRVSQLRAEAALVLQALFRGAAIGITSERAVLSEGGLTLIDDDLVPSHALASNVLETDRSIDSAFPTLIASNGSTPPMLPEAGGPSWSATAARVLPERVQPPAPPLSPLPPCHYHCRQ